MSTAQDLAKVLGYIGWSVISDKYDVDPEAMLSVLPDFHFDEYHDFPGDFDACTKQDIADALSSIVEMRNDLLQAEYNFNRTFGLGDRDAGLHVDEET